MNENPHRIWKGLIFWYQTLLRCFIKTSAIQLFPQKPKFIMHKIRACKWASPWQESTSLWKNMTFTFTKYRKLNDTTTSHETMPISRPVQRASEQKCMGVWRLFFFFSVWLRLIPEECKRKEQQNSSVLFCIKNMHYSHCSHSKAMPREWKVWILCL